MSTAVALNKYIGATDGALTELYRMDKIVRQLYLSLDKVQQLDERGLLTASKCGEVLVTLGAEVRAAEMHLAQAQKILPAIDEDGFCSEKVPAFSLRQRSEAGARGVGLGSPEESTNGTAVFDSNGARRRLGQILLEAGAITEEELTVALAEKEKFPYRHLGEILVERGYTCEEFVARVLAKVLGLGFVELATEGIEGSAVRCLGGRLALRHQCIPVRKTLDYVYLAIANPFDLVAIDDVERNTGLKVISLVATAQAIRAAHGRHYPAMIAFLEERESALASSDPGQGEACPVHSGSRKPRKRSPAKKKSG